MTTDLLTYGKTEQTPAALRSGLYRNTKNQSRKKLSAAKGIPDVTALEADGWTRKISVVLAHLNLAHKQLGAAEAALAAQQNRIALLEDLATTDDLTGLKNRRGFYEGFTRELECCERGISKGGLIVMIDLDNFKTVNDTFGHQAGDAVLKLVGKTLQNEIRKMDIAARLGGDEFVLLLSNTTQAATRAQVIGWHLNNLSLAWDGNIIPVRASVGLKSFGAGDTAETVLRAADGTLYATKFERKTTAPTTDKGEPPEQAP
jgi:diguanylate cyclase (GGDEF)-like protein